MRKGIYFVSSLSVALVLAVSLALAPIQYGATVHSGLTTSHTKIDKGGVVESATATLVPKLATMGGGGLAVILPQGATGGYVTFTAKNVGGAVVVTPISIGAGVFTLGVGTAPGPSALVAGSGAVTVDVSAGSAISAQVTWFQDTPE